MTPTPEQTEIVEHFRDTTENMIVSALAGAAKTTTLIMMAKALPGKRMLCLAFNKRIADEMKTKLPANCEALTLNSLGHRAWGQSTGRRLIVEKDKIYRIMTELVMPKITDSEDRKEAFEIMSDAMKAVRVGKSSGYIPTGHYTSNATRLHDDESFFAELDEAPTPTMEHLIRKTTLLSLEAAWRGEIDYDDQILMPTVFPSIFPKFEITLIDEAQDLSSLNHAMLRKVVRQDGRLIAVGDPNQSIYAFRGAHEHSMGLMQQDFSMTEKRLTVSFRCPIKVVEEARFRAPDMKYPEWAIEGEVKHFQVWTVDDIPNHATILCRNNAPLFSMAIRMLQNNRAPELVGNDIGKGLIKIMRKFGESSMPKEDLLTAIEGWKEEKLKKTRSPDSVLDRAACMRVFAEQGKNLGDAIAYAEHIFATAGPVKLMTGHKSKGLEFENVFILDRKMINMERNQERNLLYVMQTRAKKFLGYITTEGFHEQ